MNTYFERLENIRAMMREKNWDAIVITASDPHSSEYPAPRWKQVEWLTGFSGECGDIVITQDHAGLWTDTRYFIAANQALPGTGYELHKTRVPEQILIPEWLAGHAFPYNQRNIVVAVDGLTHSLSAVNAIKEAFSATGREEDDEDKGFKIVNAPDLLDNFWDDRPAIPRSPIITLGDDLTGESRQDKILWLRGFLMKNGCDAILLTALDEIAWMLNVRGQDVMYNPVVISYLVISMDEVNWYVKKNAISTLDDDTVASFKELKDDGVNIMPYDDVDIALAGLMEDGYVKKLFVDPSTLNYNLYNVLSSNSIENGIKFGTSPVPLENPSKMRSKSRA